MNKPITKTYVWKKLAAHYHWHKNDEMKDLFAKDPKRADKYTLNMGNLYFDYSKNRFNEKTIQKLESVLGISIPDISNDAEAIIKDMEESQTI